MKGIDPYSCCQQSQGLREKLKACTAAKGERKKYPRRLEGRGKKKRDEKESLK